METKAGRVNETRPRGQVRSRDEGQIIEWGAWPETCYRGAAMTIRQAGYMISCNLSLPFPLV
jgi:hypothetical protein